MKHQSKDLCQTEWEMVSDLLDGQDLPESINEQIYGLRDGTHMVIQGWQPIETAPKDIYLLLDYGGGERISAGRYWSDMREWRDWSGRMWSTPDRWMPMPPTKEKR